MRQKYRVDRVLGVGGMATVYAATHRNKTRVALKVLRPEVAMNPEMCQRFLREGYVANSLGHPNAVMVTDDDVTDDGAPYLVMELLEGETLDDLAERAHAFGRPLDLAFVLTAAHALADVLAAAHAHGIVHRDVKPGNVFITYGGQLKVLDFGIARLRDDSHAGASATRTGTSFGSPAFMSPEQARGKTSLVGPHSDVWSVGATMFTVLTGRNVHVGESSQEIMIAGATLPAPSIARFCPALPPAVVALVDRALAFAPEMRFGSGVELRDAIAALYSSLYGTPVPPSLVFPNLPRPVVVGPPSAPASEPYPNRLAQTTVGPMSTYVAPPTPFASPRSIALLVGAAALAVAVAGVSFWRASRPAPLRAEAVNVRLPAATSLAPREELPPPSSSSSASPVAAAPEPTLRKSAPARTSPGAAKATKPRPVGASPFDRQ